MSPIRVGRPSPLSLSGVTLQKRALHDLLKQISCPDGCFLPPPSGSGLRTPDPSGGFYCPVFHVLNSTSTLVWAFVQV